MTQARNGIHDRRAMLKLAGGVVASVTFVSACGSGEKPAGGGARSEVSAETEAAVRQAVASGQVGVGQAAFLGDAGVVVTQPTAGDYKVFSDVCPHQNGKVTMRDQASGRLVCVLHGSQFDPVTGEVAVGPAARGLSPIDMKVGAGTPKPSA